MFHSSLTKIRHQIPERVRCAKGKEKMSENMYHWHTTALVYRIVCGQTGVRFSLGIVLVEISHENATPHIHIQLEEQYFCTSPVAQPSILAIQVSTPLTVLVIPSALNLTTSRT